MRRIPSFVVVAAVLLVVPVLAQESQQPPTPPGRNLLSGLSGTYRLQEREPRPAVSVLDRLTVAKFLAEAGINREHYSLAGPVAQLLSAEGIDPAELAISPRTPSSATPARTAAGVFVIGLVILLLLLAAWQPLKGLLSAYHWFGFRAADKAGRLS